MTPLAARRTGDPRRSRLERLQANAKTLEQTLAHLESAIARAVEEADDVQLRLEPIERRLALAREGNRERRAEIRRLKLPSRLTRALVAPFFLLFGVPSMWLGIEQTFYAACCPLVGGLVTWFEFGLPLIGIAPMVNGVTATANDPGVLLFLFGLAWSAFSFLPANGWQDE